MKKFLALVAAVALVLGVGSVAYANFCATDVVPAATILYPFVQYNYTDPNVNTLFSVTNVSSEAVIVHFTLWTDYSVHVVDWNVVLSGYDVQTFSIRDILDTPGQLPSTGTDASGVQGPGDSDYEAANKDQYTGVGPVEHTLNASESTPSLRDRCYPVDPKTQNGFDGYPDFRNRPFPPAFKSFMEEILTYSQTVTRYHMDCNGNQDSPSYNDWFEIRTTNDPTWMYITADVTYACNKAFPDSSNTYWSSDHVTPDGTNAQAILQGGQVMYDNVLIGDIYYVNQAQNFSEAINAVSLEADPGWFDLSKNPSPTTFYHQYVESTGEHFSATSGDYREPLPTAWAFRYANMGSAFSTQIRVFKRGTGVNNGNNGVYDLMAQDPSSKLVADDTVPYSLYFWDESEEALLWLQTSGGPWSPGPPPTCRINEFPLETQQVDIDQFGVPFTSGWALLVYPPSNGMKASTNQTNGTDNYQVYVSTRQSANVDPSHYSAVLQGAVLANANCYPKQVLPALWAAGTK